MRCSWGVLLLVPGLGACLGDDDPPELLELKPRDGVDLRGVGEASIYARYRDDSEVTARVFIDENFVGTADRACGESACSADFVWNTEEFPPGPHDLTVALEDAAGNVTTETHQVLLDDVLTITGMRVSNIVDESGTLEIEAYAFDAANNVIGCAGSRHGLATVDNAGIEYRTDAVLIGLDLAAFGTAQTAGQPFRIEIWEDDDAPVCPEPLEPTANDFVGRSPAFTADEWRAQPLLMFDNVTKLGVAWGRPLAELEVVNPPPAEPPPLFGDGSGNGCQVTDPSSAGALLVLVTLGLRRRRSVAGRR